MSVHPANVGAADHIFFVVSAQLRTLYALETLFGSFGHIFVLYDGHRFFCRLGQRLFLDGLVSHFEAIEGSFLLLVQLFELGRPLQAGP